MTRSANGERYETRINRAIALVDANLDSDLSLSALAEVACLSPHHFHRVFSSLVGETVHAFTTRLRLERAVALARLEPQLAWKQIAGRCGYRSMAVFSRAFRRHYGVGPAGFDLDAHWADRPDAAEAMQVSRYFLRPIAAPPADFEVEVVRRPEARIAVSRAWGAYLDAAVFMTAYTKLMDWAAREGLPTDGGRLSGGSRDDPEITPLSRCRYDFMLEVPAGMKVPAGMSAATRPEGDWAITAVVGGMDAVDRGWNLLWKSWLPRSGLALRDAPCEEVYRRTPAEIGWKSFDLLCCVPIERGGSTT